MCTVENSETTAARKTSANSLVRLASALSIIALAAMPLLAAAQEPATPSVISAASGASPTKMRATISLGARKVSFAGDLEPLARRAVAFDVATADVTDSARVGIGELKDALGDARVKLGLAPASPIVIIAYGQDAERAYRRARAVRGELIERHQADAATIIAAGRQAPGHTDGTTVIDVYAIDPASCAGCNGTTLSTIARDSGAMQLVTALLEAAPEARQTAGVAPAPRVQQPRRIAPVAAAKPAEETRETTVAPPAQPAARQALPRQRIASASCPRPRIIIDDYYPGGPIVPCRGFIR